MIRARTLFGRVVITTLIAMLGLPISFLSAVTAGEPASWWPWRCMTGAAGSPPAGTICGCCDDYCPKSAPCPCPAPLGRVNDYCPKPLPQVCPVPVGCCDNYCAKPWLPLPWCPPGAYLCLPAGCPRR